MSGSVEADIWETAQQEEVLDNIETESCSSDQLFVAQEDYPKQTDAPDDDDDDESYQPRWVVDHSSGHHKFRAGRFIEKILSDGFEATDALKMLQERHTIDFGSRSAGCSHAKPSDGFFPQFFLDFFSIVGKPGRPITRADCPMLDNVTVSFQKWGDGYSAKHVSGIPFDITGRTFRVAQAATREVWFIVMHPVAGEVTQLRASAAQSRRQRELAAENSRMSIERARQLAAYITTVFQSPELLGEGVEPCWRPGTKHSQRISSSRWTAFQESFMNGWATWANGCGEDAYWKEHEPAFHAYDYGANIEIEVGERLYDLPRERHTPQYDNSDDEDHDDKDDDDDGTVGQDESGPGIQRLSTRADEDAGDISLEPQHQQMLGESAGLRKLTTELGSRFRLENMSTISYALAVCINSEAGDSTTRCLLADRNMLAREFPSRRDFTFYPQAFHPTYGNFSSRRPPAFLESLLMAMRGNMSNRNEGADVLSFGYFQGYSNTKRSVRHSPDDLLATKGYATAALTVPAADVSTTTHLRDKRNRFLRIIRGEATPENPDESKPFARERRQMDVAIEHEEVAFRLEQVVSLNVRQMVSAERTFAAVIRPIFQLIRFFLVEHESYVHIFRSMPLSIFPKIMCAYSRLFELALGEMERRFVQGRAEGLDLAHSEAVAVLDRLGGYLFTGHERHLPKTVLRPLGTIDSLRAGAWPYVNPAVLDLGAAGAGGAAIHMSRWPHSASTGRPVLLHAGELRYHYGAQVASNRESVLWFNELGEAPFASRSAVADFTTGLLRELWIPQTRQFIVNQLKRRLREGGEPVSQAITSQAGEACMSAIAAWELAADAFALGQLERLVKGLTPGGSRVAIVSSGSRTRLDFASELLRAVRTNKGRETVAPLKATWPSQLHLAVTNGHNAAGGGVQPEEWAGVLTSCLLAVGVEWVPTCVRGRLTSRNITVLHGQAGVTAMLKGPPGSLRRAAQEAEIKHEKTVKERVQRQGRRRRIDFGCPMPFTNIPPLILAGFNQAKATFSGKGDAKVLDHYQLAITCLAGKIDDPLCHLMLMITLTVCSSSETPEVVQGSHTFSAAAKRKDPGQLALVMVTRMMWFLYPTCFPWAKNSGGTAYDVAEMTKKIEHKGCSNRMLRELGWVTSKSQRDSPRNTDVQLRPQEELEKTVRDLRAALKRPDDFISRIFHSQDEIWVERCASIIKG